MDSNRIPRHPAPDAYDHLWRLLPLHMTFALYWLLSVLADYMR